MGFPQIKTIQKKKSLKLMKKNPKKVKNDTNPKKIKKMIQIQKPVCVIYNECEVSPLC